MQHNTTLVITYTAGKESRLALDINQSTQTLDDGITAFDITATALTDNAVQLAISATPIMPEPIRFMDIFVTLPPQMQGDDTRVFISGYTTNDPARCVNASTADGMTSMDDIIYKNCLNNSFYAAAFVTVDKFFTYIKLENGCFTMRHSMEDKPLNGTVEAERMMLCLPRNEHEFFMLYTGLLAKRYGKTDKNIPTGWCSWSCYYKNVTAQKIYKANDELSRYFSHGYNLVQIDDGWQSKNSFCGDWQVDESKFPSPMQQLAQACNRQGRAFGLWLAPMLASNESGFFTKHPKLKYTKTGKTGNEHSYMLGDDNVYTIDIAEQEALDNHAEIFRRCSKEYGAGYFKLDFLIFALHRLWDREDFIIYNGDYSGAVYRKALQNIKNNTDNAFLLACGAPIAMGAGIFDGIRITPDIIWGDKNPASPNSWELIKMCTGSIACRYFYNGNLFINDPDGLVMRDYDNGDGFDVTYQEARLWATSVAFSGGSVLVNETMDELSPARRELFNRIMPPIGIAGRPTDFFELPQPSKLYITDENGVLVALYNYSDRITDIALELADIGITGDAVCVNAWTGDYCGTVNGSFTARKVLAHGAEVLRFVPLGNTPRFAYALNNLYTGTGVYHTVFGDDCITVSASKELASAKDNSFFIYLPDGYGCSAPVASVLNNGKLYRFYANPGQTQCIKLSKN